MATPNVEDVPIGWDAPVNVFAESNQNDPNVDNNNVTFHLSVVKGMDLVYSIITNSTVAYIGEEYTYNVNILNKGPSSPTQFGTNTVSNDPDKYEVLSYNSNLGMSGRAAPRSRVILWFTVHDEPLIEVDENGYSEEVYYGLYVGEDTNITFVIKPLALGEITLNHFAASSPISYFDLNGEDNEVTQVVTVHSVTNLELNLEKDLNEINPGDIVTYTVTLKNNGEYLAENVKLDIVKPEILEAVEDYSYDIGDIASGETKTLTYKYKLTDYGVVDYNVTVLTDSKNTNADVSKKLVLESLRPISILSLSTSSSSNGKVTIKGTTNVNTGTVTLTIKNQKGETVLTTDVSILSNGAFKKSIRLSDGKYTVNAVTSTDSKSKTFTLSTPEPEVEPVINDTNNTNVTNITNDTIINLSTSLIINYQLINDTVRVYGTLLDENNNPLSDNIVISVSNKNYHTKTNTNGEYSLDLSLLSGTYSIQANYDGNENYKSSSNSVSLVIVNVSTNTIINEEKELEQTYGNENNYNGVLTDKAGNNLIGYHIALNITRLSSGASKIYYLTTDYLGRYNLPINLAPGEYTIDASINDQGFVGESFTKLVIKADESKTQLKTEDKIINYSTHGQFTGVLESGLNNPIAGAHLKLTLSNAHNQSKTYDLVTDYIGAFSLPINLAPGRYNIVTSFEGFNEYESKIVENSVFVI